MLDVIKQTLDGRLPPLIEVVDALCGLAVWIGLLAAIWTDGTFQLIGIAIGGVGIIGWLGVFVVAFTRETRRHAGPRTGPPEDWWPW